MNEQPKPIIKNCSTCAHSYFDNQGCAHPSLRLCHITGQYCDIHRRRLPEKEGLCDENFSAWVEKTEPETPKTNWYIIAHWASVIFMILAAIYAYLK